VKSYSCAEAPGITTPVEDRHRHHSTARRSINNQLQPSLRILSVQTTTMAEASPPANPLRRVLTGEESAQLRRRPPTNRFSTMATGDDGAVPTPGVRRRSTTANLEDGATRGEGVGGVRRRSSNFSDYSLREARRSFQSSTDDLLLPKAKGGEEGGSAWHSAPLAFALLPAVGGMLFTNGSSIITDVMLLGLAAIFLNWSVRIPW